MNFLAHLYLSKENKNILIGNFIADAVKGKRHENYSREIQAGILLHREIDTYTDQHPIVRRSKKRLHKRYNHYSGVIIDILYDHFLAKNWSQYSNIPLDVYANGVYDFLYEKIKTFPEKIQYMLPYMIEYDWLSSYAEIEGIKRILDGMNRRTQGKSNMDLAIEDLNSHYSEFETDFTDFFKELEDFTSKKTTLLLAK